MLQGPAGNAVVGNWIGTASDGTTAAGNGNGVLVETSGHVIGGLTPAERNVISGNTNGVNIGTRPWQCRRGNQMGRISGTLDVGNTRLACLSSARPTRSAARRPAAETSSRGTTRRACGSPVAPPPTPCGEPHRGRRVRHQSARQGIGVQWHDGASTNVIGGDVAGAGNEIAFERLACSLIGLDNAIFGNSIHQNGTLGMIHRKRRTRTTSATPIGVQQPDQLPGADRRHRRRARHTQQHPGHNIPDCVFQRHGVRFLWQRRGPDIPRKHGGHDRRDRQRHDPALCRRGRPVRHGDGHGWLEQHVGSACVTPLGVAAEMKCLSSTHRIPSSSGASCHMPETVTNHGPSPATDVRLTALWNGPLNVNATSPSGTCELTPLLTCTFGRSSGATATLGIVGTPGAIGLLGSTFTLQADEKIRCRPTTPGGEYGRGRWAIELRGHEHERQWRRISQAGDSQRERERRGGFYLFLGLDLSNDHQSVARCRPYRSADD